MSAQHELTREYSADKKQDIEFIEDKEQSHQIDANAIRTVETAFEGYTEEETAQMSKKLVRLIDWRVLPVLVLLFLVRRLFHPCKHVDPPAKLSSYS
jgi:hypothetical protein